MTKYRPSSQKTAKIKRGVIMLKKKCCYKSQSEFLKGVKYSLLGSVFIFAGLLVLIVFGTFFFTRGVAPSVLSEDYSGELNGIVTLVPRFLIFLLLAAGGIVCSYSEYSFFLNKKNILFLLGTGNKRKKMLASRTAGAYASMLFAIAVPFFINLALNISAFGFSTEYLKMWLLFVISSVETVLVFYTLMLFALYVSHSKSSALFSFAGALCLFPSISYFVHFIFNKNLSGYLYEYHNEMPIRNYLTFAPLNPLSNVLSFNNDPSYMASYEYSLSYKDSSSPVTFSGAVIIPVFWMVICLFATSVIIYAFSKKYEAEKFSNERHPVLITSLCAVSASLVTFMTIDLIVVLEDAMAFPVRILISLGVCFIISVLFFAVKRKVLKLIVPLGVSACVFASVYLISVTGGFGYETRIPAVEKIKSAEVLIDGQIAPFENITEFKSESEIKKVTEMHSEVLKNEGEKTDKEINIKYNLKNGISLTRSFKSVSVNSVEKLYGLFDTEAVNELYEKFLFCDKENRFYKQSYGREVEIKDYCTDFENKGNYVYILSEKYALTDLTKILSADEIEELKKSIYSDICSLSAEEMFFNNEKTAGYILFSMSKIEDDYLMVENNNPYSFCVPVKMNMKNTLKTLEKFGIKDCLQKNREIKSVILYDTNKEFKFGHFYFVPVPDMGIYNNLNLTVYADPVLVKKITNQKEIKDTLEKCNAFCDIEEKDRFAFVEFSDGFTVMYLYKAGENNG